MVVGDMLFKNAVKFPGRVAIVSQGLSITYGDLNKRVNRLANAVGRIGLRKGDRIGVLLHNSFQFVELYFAAAKTGAVFCPYNNHSREQELLDTINYSSPKFLFYDVDYAGMIETLKGDIGSIDRYIGVPATGQEWALDYEALIDRGEITEPPPSVREDDAMSIFFTSGTTGKPKGAVRSHRHVMANAFTGLIEFKIGYDERVLVLFPMYHVSYEDNLGRSFLLPNTMVIRREGNFNADEVLALLSAQKITFCHMVPTMINALLQSEKMDSYDLGRLRTIFYAGAPMPLELLQRALAVFRASFFQGYGLTESGPQTTLLRPDDHLVEGSPQKLARLGSVGTPVFGFEVKIVNEEGREVQTGEVGEIIARGEAVMQGYWQLPHESEDRLRNGWLYTGDVGKMDGDGYVYLVDRKHDMIITGGINVYPKEVEEVLYRHPAVFEAAVFGVPDEYWGEAIKAVIALKEGRMATEAEIIGFCGKHLAGYKKPKSVQFRPELPKSPQGKILKRAIKEKYWAGTGRKI
jgi:acyl-CoA synthetase (AMP-forming)/AMP-acid ligase II